MTHGMGVVRLRPEGTEVLRRLTAKFHFAQRIPLGTPLTSIADLIGRDHPPCHPSPSSPSFPCFGPREVSVEPVLAAITNATATHCRGDNSS